MGGHYFLRENSEIFQDPCKLLHLTHYITDSQQRKQLDRRRKPGLVKHTAECASFGRHNTWRRFVVGLSDTCKADDGFGQAL